MALSKKAKTKLGALASDADKTVHDLIRERGGNAKNARQAGHWQHKPLAEAAEAAAAGDASAEKAVKLVKQARRLGEKH